MKAGSGSFFLRGTGTIFPPPIAGRIRPLAEKKMEPVPKKRCLTPLNKLKGTITMEEFKNVTVIKKANAYFGGKVTSRTVLFPDGTKKTLGIMMPGDYEFGTAEKEIMEILAGKMEIQLPGSSAWQPVKGGESFEVPAHSKFKLKVAELADYCCSYIK
jgi:uncharacterized protein YaiE (UPF0345 family)